MQIMNDELRTNEHDRRKFPWPLVDVTGGQGGDCILILGPEKTAVYDAGMCCFADKTIENIKAKLKEGDRKVDYIILSHSHYDHMGALPYLLEEWPDAVVCASGKAKKVFESTGARATIEKMGKNAARLYGVDEEKVMVNNLRVDRILSDRTKISLGKGSDGAEAFIEAIETKGHTDCALSYMVMPEGILMCSESCGVLVDLDKIEVSALKSFDESIRSANILKAKTFNHLYSQHYGMVPDWFRYKYFSLFIHAAEYQKQFIDERIKAGCSEEEILREHEARFRDENRAKEQPYEAYKINAICEIRQEIRNFSENSTGL